MKRWREVVSHLCCVDRTLVAVIWGRIYWKPLDGEWLASRWVPLAMPGEEATVSNLADTAVKLAKPRRRRARSSKRLPPQRR